MLKKKKGKLNPVKSTQKELIGLKLNPSLVEAFDLVAEYSGIKRSAFYQQVLEYAYWNYPVVTGNAEFKTIHDAYTSAISQNKEEDSELDDLENDLD